MRLRSIYLENFRSHRKLRLNINKSNFVLLIGKNGIGKTNLLEAISFLSPGRGFRNSKFNDILKRNSSKKHWLIQIEIENDKKKYKIVISFSQNKFNKSNSKTDKKIIKIDGKMIKKRNFLNCPEYDNILELEQGKWYLFNFF